MFSPRHPAEKLSAPRRLRVLVVPSSYSSQPPHDETQGGFSQRLARLVPEKYLSAPPHLTIRSDHHCALGHATSHCVCWGVVGIALIILLKFLSFLVSWFLDFLVSWFRSFFFKVSSHPSFKASEIEKWCLMEGNELIFPNFNFTFSGRDWSHISDFLIID